MKPSRGHVGCRDAGATLVMILVLIAVAGLILVPTMTYAVAVMRSNEVLSDRTASAEAAKGGLRTALADPRWLYEQCSSSTPTVLSLPQMTVGTTTSCELVQEVTRYAVADLPWAAATTWFGAAAPDDALIEGTNRPADDTTTPVGDENTWISFTSPDRVGAPTTPGLEGERPIWLPALPTPATTVRGPTGYAMPAGQINSGFTDCTVYFPGTYPDPVVIDGPTYFTSGVYYFEAPLTVADGANVVLGSGQHLGCTDDQRAAFSAIDVPSTHNITGVGATIVLGGGGRLIIGPGDPASAAPVSFKMNTRYVAADSVGLLPSVEVSIQTVNGALDETGAPVDLHIAGGLHVPLGVVGGDTATTLGDAGYVPSTVVASASGPTAVGSVTATAYDAAIVVDWQPPVVSYGVEGYIATAVPADGTSSATCAAADFRRSCAIAGLSNDVDYTVYVVAVTTDGGSPPSAGVVATPSASLDGAPVPSVVTVDTAASVYDDSIVITWQPPSDVAVPVESFTATVPAVVGDDGSGGTVTVFDGGTCTSDGQFHECAVALPAGVADQIVSLDVEATVIATNTAGDSPATATALTTTRVAGDYQAPTPEVQEPPTAAPPVIAVSTESAAPIVVDIPGYVAVPQGGVSLDHPSGSPGSLRIDGGLVAATIALSATCGTATCVVGQTNEPIQRVVRLVTATTEGIDTRSDAVVQINSNGAWVVNSWSVASF